MKRVSISIISVLIVCSVVASLSASMLTPAQFPKTADDLTFGQRVDLLADGYRPFDTVFDSNGVCIENCPYVGITIKDFEKQMQQAAQQVQQDLAELNMQYPIDPDSVQGTVPASDNNISVSEIKDVETNIANYLANYIQTQSGVDVRNNLTVQQRLNDIAANVRTELINKEPVNVDLGWLSQVVPTVNLSSVTLTSSNLGGEIQNGIEAFRIHEPQGGGSSSAIPVSCPLQVNPVRVSSEMGWRSSFRRNHNGIDLRVPVGTPIYAAADGRVVIRKNNPDGYGYYLSIQHDRNYYTVYGHLSQWLVQNGDTVRAGQQIAKSGNTGRSTGPHLHFEVLKNAPLVRSGAIPVNPRTITQCTWSPKNNRSNTRDNRR